MDWDLPPNWTAEHDQVEAELRELVRPIVTSMLAVRRMPHEEAMEEGVRLAATMAEHLGPLSQGQVLELLFIALSKIATNALEQYDDRMERLYEQARAHARSQRDAGSDAGGTEE